jgi:glutamate-1-semialdehyde 2,1-aminomutase
MRDPMKNYSREKNNADVISGAGRSLAGGVNSPVRAFNYVGGDPVPIKKGSGSRVYDYNGKEYIDYVLSYGALVLGHAPKEVCEGVKEAITSGTGFGAVHHYETELAQRITRAIPSAKKVRFTSSGTEAVMGAVRLARGATGRDKIIKFKGSYHGHADHLLAKAGSGLATLGLPDSAGVPEDFTRHTMVAQYGSKESVERVFKKYGRDIAAVIVEPVGGNDGVVPPNVDFLKYLRSATQRSGAVLIADEVITGFRFRYGSIMEGFGIRPDIICLGKIIGGGLPIGAYGGSEKMMKNLAPEGDVYQASTFAGNPIVMRAGIETLDLLERLKPEYGHLSDTAAYLAESIAQQAQTFDIGVETQQYGGVFSLRFKERDDFRYYYKALLAEGVYFAPSEHEANFISFAHTDGDIRKTLEASENAFARLAEKEITWQIR